MDFSQHMKAAARLQIESLSQLVEKYSNEKAAHPSGSDNVVFDTSSAEMIHIANQVRRLTLEWSACLKHMDQTTFNTVFSAYLECSSIPSMGDEGIIGFKKLCEDGDIIKLLSEYPGDFHSFHLEASGSSSTHAVVSFLKLLKSFPLPKLIPVESPSSEQFIKAIKSYVSRLPHSMQISPEALPFASRSSLDKISPGGPVGILVEDINGNNSNGNNKKEIWIMPVGRSGVGKSCLVNEFLQLPSEVRSPETNPLEPLEPQSSVTSDLLECPRKWKDTVVTCVDTPGLEGRQSSLNCVWNMIVTRLLDGFSSEHSDSPPIDVIWYCLPASLDRLDAIDAQWVRTLACFIPVVLVLPKSIRSSTAFEHQLDQMRDPLPVVSRLRVLARDDSVEGASVSQSFAMESFGLGELGRITARCLGEADRRRKLYIETVTGTTDDDFARKRRWAYSVIMGAAASSATVGLAQMSFADVTLLAPIQVGMITAIIAIYGLSFEKGVITGLATSMLTSGLASLGGPRVAQWLLELGKNVPVLNIGTSVVCGGIAGGVTMLIGMSVVASLEVLRQGHGNLIGIDYRKFEMQVIEEMKQLAAHGAAGIAEQFLKNQMS